MDSSTRVCSAGEVRISQIPHQSFEQRVKYTREGSVTSNVRCERQALNRVRVWYGGGDTGLGVMKENIPYIFNASVVWTRRETAISREPAWA